MKMNSLGSQLNPARNNNDIRKALIGRRYGIIYTLGTFKIDSTGFRLGERFVKIIFDNAIERKVEEIYVTLFEDRQELLALGALLRRWGFYEYGIKKTMVKKNGYWLRK